MEIPTIIIEIFIYFGNYFHFMAFDEKDLRILERLSRPHRKYMKDIAQELQLPITTVHNRIKKLEKQKVILGYKAVIDYEKINKSALAIIFIKTDVHLASPKDRVDLEALAQKIGALENVEESYVISGDWDILLKIRSDNVNRIHKNVIKKIRFIEGVAATHTVIALPQF